MAETFGAKRNPLACCSRHVPIVRRSCHPIPGPTGSPVARSQTTVDARWFVIPTASTGPPNAASAARAASMTVSASTWASNSTSPGAGESGSGSRSCSWCTVASAETIAARTDEVPMSRTSRLMARWVRPRDPGARACPG